MNTARAALWALMGLILLVAAGGAAVTLIVSEPPYESSYIEFVMLAMLVLILVAPLAVTLHRPAYRAGGILLCVVLMVLWSAVILLCFSLDLSWLNSNRVYGTAAVFLFMGIPAAVGLMCRDKPWGAAFCWAIVSIAAVTGAIALICLWAAPQSGDNTLFEKTGLSAVWAYLFAGSGTALLINLGRGDRRYFRWLGVFAALVATVCGVRMVWVEGTGYWGIVANVAWLATVTLGFTNLLLMTRQKGAVRLAKWVTIGLVWVAGAATTTWVLHKFCYPDSPNSATVEAWMERAMAASTLLAEGSLLCLLVARTLVRIKPRPTVPAGLDRVEMKCPNCGTSQVLGLEGACVRCLLKFRVVLAEPRCPRCDHLLLNLTSDRCPECGCQIKRPAQEPIPAP